MHRRQLLIAGGSLMALTACATPGQMTGGSGPTGAPDAATLAEEARIGRAVLPTQTPRAELLREWTGPYEGVPPWNQVTAPKLREAILEGIELRRAEYQAIAANPEAPTFANTMVAMQMAGEPLSRALSLFGVMTSNIGSDDYQAVDREVSPLLSAAGDEITFNEALFARIRAVADNASGLTAQQRRVAERSRDQFIRGGAALDAAKKAQLGQPVHQLRPEGRRRREHLDADPQRSRRGRSSGLQQDGRGRRGAQPQSAGLGHRQHALQRGPLPDLRR
jgi:peptidyl-dipeptidase Dcp